MKKLANIIKSRFINGENLPEWYEKRLEICSTCPLNSKNQEEKTTGRKAWELIAGAHCTDPSCGCTITEKSKIESEACPKGKWLPIEISGASKASIKNLSENVASISYSVKDRCYFLDYGQIKMTDNTEVNLFISKKDISEFIKAYTSCGCTKAQWEEQEAGYKITTSYTTKIGGINQAIQIQYNDPNKTLRVITIKLKGTVIN